jgi:fermentation-respiration switch protein FrsA (DUF1100 family)
MHPAAYGLRYWFRLVGTLVVALALGSAGAMAFLAYTRAHSYLHPERHVASGDWLSANAIEFETVELTTEDGVRLRAWYTAPRNGAVILVAHGHAASIPEDVYALFTRHGYGVVAWDFRAHGESGGEFTSLGYYEVLDAKAALEFALSRPEVQHVGGWGGSMGAATLLLSAAQFPEIEAVVADSSFSTLEAELDHRVPVPVFRELTGFFAELQTGAGIDAVRPMEAIARLSPRPVFIIQGLRDTMIPLDSARDLFEAAGEPRYLWTDEKAYHLNMFPKYPEEYEQRVIEFFDAALLQE